MPTSKSGIGGWIFFNFFLNSEVGENYVKTNEKNIEGYNGNDIIYDNKNSNLIIPKNGIDTIINNYKDDNDIFEFFKDDKKIKVKDISLFESAEKINLEDKVFDTSEADHIKGIHKGDKIEIFNHINNVDFYLKDGINDNAISVQYAIEKDNNLIITDDKFLANSILILYDQDENIGNVDLNGIVINDIDDIDGFFVSSNGEIEFF